MVATSMFAMRLEVEIWRARKEREMMAKLKKVGAEPPEIWARFRSGRVADAFPYPQRGKYVHIYLRRWFNARPFLVGQQQQNRTLGSH